MKGQSKEAQRKTGDPHPLWKFAAFVEYDEITGKEVWCSVYGDSEAPCRLAKMSEQRRMNSKGVDGHHDNRTPRPGQE
jgi:hypothetical protein